MNNKTWDMLDTQFAEFAVMKAAELPAESEIAEAALALGCTFHDDYLAFLRRYGGAMVGPLPIFGLRPVKVMGKRWSVVEVTNSFRAEGWPGVENWYVISEDGFGNPIGVAPDGRVMVSDHDAGEVAVFAEDLETFLLSGPFHK